MRHVAEPLINRLGVAILVPDAVVQQRGPARGGRGEGEQVHRQTEHAAVVEVGGRPEPAQLLRPALQWQPRQPSCTDQ